MGGECRFQRGFVHFYNDLELKLFCKFMAIELFEMTESKLQNYFTIMTFLKVPVIYL